MSSINRVFISGNLTRDPEVRYTPSGMAVADLGVAVNESYKNKAGEWEEKTCFVDVVVWGKRAEECAEHLRKGSPVMIEGKLQLDQWQNKEGEKRSKLRINAFSVQFVLRPPKAEQGDAPEGAGRASAPAADVPPREGGDDDALPF